MKIFLISIFVVIAVVAGIIITRNGSTQVVQAPSYDEVEEPSSDVRVCVADDPQCIDDLIIVASPQAESIVTSPLIIEGMARGGWFFEATFPIVLTNWDGLIIAEGYATADGDWMTSEYVPFSGTLEFDIPPSIDGVVNRGSLILHKSNASGLPEHDNALEFVVYFD